MFIGVHKNCNLRLGTEEDHAVFCNDSTNLWLSLCKDLTHILNEEEVVVILYYTLP